MFINKGYIDISMLSRNKKLPSFWEWTFKGKAYYILFAIYFFINDAFWNVVNGESSPGIFFGDVLGLAIILAILFFIFYLVYKAGYKKRSS